MSPPEYQPATLMERMTALEKRMDLVQKGLRRAFGERWLLEIEREPVKEDMDESS